MPAHTSTQTTPATPTLVRAALLTLLLSGCAAPVAFQQPGATGTPPAPTGPAAGPTGPLPEVRFVYAHPADRPFRQEYADSLARAIPPVQAYYQKWIGRTFSVPRGVESCTLPGPASDYSTGTWGKVATRLRGCVPLYDYDGQQNIPGTPPTDWIVYADVDHACGDPDRLGGGLHGLAMMPARDLEGLIGHNVPDDCGVMYADDGVQRWYGGLAHELGHSLGLDHEATCKASGGSSPDCDVSALMWAGYTNFPAARLLPQEVAFFRTSPFLR